MPPSCRTGRSSSASRYEQVARNIITRIAISTLPRQKSMLPIRFALGIFRGYQSRMARPPLAE